MTQTRLFDEPMQGPAALGAHGYRITPSWPIDVLCSLPAYQALSGPVVDLGVGGGALCKGIHERLPGGPGAATSWTLLDTRQEAIDGMADWKPHPAPVHRAVLDASQRWWLQLDDGLLDELWHQRARIVSNPPWSVLQCAHCARQWRARNGGPNCSACKRPGDDLALAMVRQAMWAMPNADVWVLHLVTWPFHERREDRPGRSAFWSDGAPASHRFAGQYQLASRRIAYEYPDGRPVAPHNVMSCWYHWTPTSHFAGQTIEIL